MKGRRIQNKRNSQVNQEDQNQQYDAYPINQLKVKIDPIQDISKRIKNNSRNRWQVQDAQDFDFQKILATTKYSRTPNVQEIDFPQSVRSEISRQSDPRLVARKRLQKESQTVLNINSQFGTSSRVSLTQRNKIPVTNHTSLPALNLRALDRRPNQSTQENSLNSINKTYSLKELLAIQEKNNQTIQVLNDNSQLQGSQTDRNQGGSTLGYQPLSKSYSLNKITAPNSTSNKREKPPLSFRQIQQLPTIDFESLDQNLDKVKLKVHRNLHKIHGSNYQYQRKQNGYLNQIKRRNNRDLHPSIVVQGSDEGSDGFFSKHFLKSTPGESSRGQVKTSMQMEQDSKIEKPQVFQKKRISLVVNRRPIVNEEKIESWRQQYRDMLSDEGVVTRVSPSKDIFQKIKKIEHSVKSIPRYLKQPIEEKIMKDKEIKSVEQLSIDLQNQNTEEMVDFKKAFDEVVASINSSQHVSDSPSGGNVVEKPKIKFQRFGKDKKYVLNRQNKMTVGKQAQIAVTHRSHTSFNRVGQGLNGLNSESPDRMPIKSPKKLKPQQKSAEIMIQETNTFLEQQKAPKSPPTNAFDEVLDTKQRGYELPPYHLRSFYLRFKEEHQSQQERMEALKQRTLEQRNISFLYRVKKLKNNHISKNQTNSVYNKMLSQIKGQRKDAHKMFQKSFAIEGNLEDEVKEPVLQSRVKAMAGKEEYFIQKRDLQQTQKFNNQIQEAENQIRVRANSKKRDDGEQPIMSYLLKSRELHLAPNSSPIKKNYQNNSNISPVKMEGSLAILNAYGQDSDHYSEYDNEADESLDYSVKSFKINDQFSKAFSAGLRSVPPINLQSKRENIVGLTLHANDMDDKMLIEILRSIPRQQISKLTISSNPKISIASYSELGRRLNQFEENHFSHIESLSLENNDMNDTELKVLFSSKQLKSSLLSLNLSKNIIGGTGCELLSRVIKDLNLEVLLLHWNKIRGPGVLKLLKAVKRNEKLLELDLSFNSIASNQIIVDKFQLPQEDESLKPKFQKIDPIPKSIYKLGRLFEKNKTLQHLDISHNGIEGLNSFSWLQNSLLRNHTILGLHIQQGNFQSIGGKAQVDTNGFLRIHKPENLNTSKDLIGTQKFERISCEDVENRLNVDNCWVCGKWKQVHFRFEAKVLKKDTTIRGKRVMHMNIETLNENFKFEEDSKMMMKEVKVKRQKPETNKTVRYRIYELFKMLPLPPLVHNNIPYQNNTLTGLQNINDSSTSMESALMERKQKSNELVPGLKYWFSDVNKSRFINKLQPNYQGKNLGQKFQISAPTLMRFTHGKNQKEFVARKINPRQPLIQPPSLKDLGPVWTKENSVFKNFVIETDSLMDSCFDFDWRCSKLDIYLNRLIKREGTVQVYEIMRQFYRPIRNVYRLFSAQQPAGGVVPCLGSNLFGEILNTCPNLLDRVNLSLATVDLKYITINAQKCQIKNLVVIKPLNPDKFLIRYQFMELLVHIAQARYKAIVNEQKNPDVEKQIKAFIKDNLSPIFANAKKFNPEVFRKELLWCKECDDVFKKNMKILKDIYAAHSGRFNDPGDKKSFMRASEFFSLIESLNVIEKPGASSEQESQKISQTNMISQKLKIFFQNKIAEQKALMRRPSKSSPLSSTALSITSNIQENIKLQFLNETGKLNARDVPVIFYQSMMTRVDELSAESHINMSIVEFLEAVARIAEKTILRSEVAQCIDIVREHLLSRGNEKNTNRQITMQEMARISLAIKIHLTIARMAMNCMSQDYVQKFERNRRPLKKELISIFSAHLDQHQSDDEESDEDFDDDSSESE